VLFISPSSGIVFVQLLAGTTLLIGMLLGWAWGVITMKAALATRSQAETNARLQQLKQAGSQNTTNTEQASGQDAYIATLIFDGFMLDTRISVTYFCMLCLFIYLVVGCLWPHVLSGNLPLTPDNRLVSEWQYQNSF
jgi:hypothetical protein